MGVLEEGGKAIGSVVEGLKASPTALAMIVFNAMLLGFMFYYLSRITTRTEVTVASMFSAQDKLFQQWGGIVKDQTALTERTMHCILPEDVERLMRIPGRPAAPAPLPPLERPAAPFGPGPILRWPISPMSDVQWPDPPEVKKEEEK